MIATGLVVRSIGYRGVPLAGVPFDEQCGVISNNAGRVQSNGTVCHGIYVTGWIKRGPRGIIGSNKKCARQTVAALIADWSAQRLPVGASTMNDINSLLAARAVRVIDRPAWLRIDRSERQAGRRMGRPRVKMVDTDRMLEA
jgi:ferredoxin--NADP+ reductase